MSFVASRVSPRRARHFSLGRQRKVPQRKASQSPCRCAVPCAARVGRGRARTRLSPQTIARPDPPAAALLGTVSMAGEPKLPLAPIFVSASVSLCPPPVWLRRAAQWSAEEAGRMFEPAGRVCGSPARSEQRRLPRSEAKGSQTPGSPFLSAVSFGDAKETASPAGARPGLQRNQTQHSTKGDSPAGPRPGLQRKKNHPTKKGSSAAGPRPG